MLKLVIGWRHKTLECIFVHLITPIYILPILIILQLVVILLFLSVEYLLLKFVNFFTNAWILRSFFNIFGIQSIGEMFVLLWNLLLIFIIDRSDVLFNVGLLSHIFFVFLDLVSDLLILVLFCGVNIFKEFVVVCVSLDIRVIFILAHLHITIWSIKRS